MSFKCGFFKRGERPGGMYDLGLLVTDSPIKTARKAEQCAVCGTEKETAGASAGSRECVISPPGKKKKTRAGNILGNVLVELQS